MFDTVLDVLLVVFLVAIGPYYVASSRRAPNPFANRGRLDRNLLLMILSLGLAVAVALRLLH
ncbi:hypothetical protein [Sphingomonas lenta]|uniref:Uncharacterized protein n=1 Tax=Sphingomonas lenta TaxID=1141887 RepID=A0A2A2SIP1_9SPHN|nr:hypothetical protein [Sphingomonas lenta]PAX09088.1 hypothetical protein CKY28_07115 [Sphingomonas lenta]